MAKHTSNIIQIALWLFVMSAGILLGGSIFEGVVLTPLWAGALPESVIQWQYGSIQTKFFAIATPLYALFSVALTIASRWMPHQQRRWAFVAGLCGVFVVVVTFLFFVPILQKTQATRGAGLSGEEITRLVKQFTAWHWGRWAVIIGSWVAGLRALSLSSS
ncbi:MAG: anthrone oxygenase family protein [Acidobacteriota bacterium]